MNRFSQDFVCVLHFLALGSELTHWNLQDINTTPVETKQTGFLAVIAIIVAGRNMEPGSVVGAKRQKKKNAMRQQKYSSEESQMDPG